ncbi:transporter substrate-binding protein [Thiomicrorhabdus indica]|uniref:transporter substrate-binding protein n=1 Tax=Thiomicrorhabdus indica TaxID=2267253 RepID=UPI002AA7863B|nr:transporter substrate-binding protein [Thiomicrorhabdus indica]
MRFRIVAAFIVIFLGISIASLYHLNQNTIKIGLLYSKTGTMATEERAIAQALKFQVEQINQQGGLLSRKIQIVEMDGASNDIDFSKGVQSLIDQGVKTIFGCWTSASRKAVRPILEENQALLFYPVQYEGLEVSPNIVYLGSTPNQQINPLFTYIKEAFGKRVLIVGSNYVFPRITGIYLTQMAEFIGFDVLGEIYRPLGETEFQEIIDVIQELKPDAIINTLNGDSNHYFFKALFEAKILSSDIPVFSTSIDERSIESMLKTLPSDALNGHYLAGSYFHALKNEKNSRLISLYRQAYGSDFLMTDAGFNTHLAFNFWKRAVVESRSTEIPKLLSAIRGDSFNSESGIVYLDRKNLHLHKTMRLMRIHNQSMELSWESQVMATPRPYPTFKNQSFWAQQETKLYQQWGERWQASDNYEWIGAPP